jgi:hypothetical protein
MPIGVTENNPQVSICCPASNPWLVVLSWYSGFRHHLNWSTWYSWKYCWNQKSNQINTRGSCRRRPLLTFAFRSNVDKLLVPGWWNFTWVIFKKMKTLCEIEGEISNWTNWHNFGHHLNWSTWYSWKYCWNQKSNQINTRGSAHWACIAHLTIEWYWSKFQREIFSSPVQSSSTGSELMSSPVRWCRRRPLLTFAFRSNVDKLLVPGWLASATT